MQIVQDLILDKFINFNITDFKVKQIFYLIIGTNLKGNGNKIFMYIYS